MSVVREHSKRRALNAFAAHIATTWARERRKPRLRFDKVAKRLVDTVQTSLADAVPNGATIVFTVTAPIRLASKTAEELEETIRVLLAKSTHSRDARRTICGNRVRIRIVEHQSVRVPRVLGFVHTADADPKPLMDMAKELLTLEEGG